MRKLSDFSKSRARSGSKPLTYFPQPQKMIENFSRTCALCKNESRGKNAYLPVIFPIKLGDQNSRFLIILGPVCDATYDDDDDRRLVARRRL